MAKVFPQVRTGIPMLMSGVFAPADGVQTSKGSNFLIVVSLDVLVRIPDRSQMPRRGLFPHFQHQVIAVYKSELPHDAVAEAKIL